jgi:hypothetical protein
VVAEVTALDTSTFAPVHEDWPRVRGAVVRFMALPAPRIPLSVFSASGLYRWGAAGITIAPLDQDFPWFSVARVQFLGRERQASPHARSGVVIARIMENPSNHKYLLDGTVDPGVVPGADGLKTKIIDVAGEVRCRPRCACATDGRLPELKGRSRLQR